MNSDSIEKPNKDQHALLVSCAIKGDFTTWNEYVSNLDETIKLRGANLSNLNISDAIFKSKNGRGADLYKANFKNSILSGIDFSDVNLMEAEFQGADISGGFFHDTVCVRAQFESTKFTMVDFTCANLQEATFKFTRFFECNFYETNFVAANLEGARFIGGGYNPFLGSEHRLNLCGASFIKAKFDNETFFDLFNVSIRTDFRATNFESANFSSGLRQTLQYCNRRHNWNDWYRQRSDVKSFFVKAFWLHSDYGNSTARIVKAFFSICFLFALIYCVFPNMIIGLEPWQPIRSLYFSIVTMTTLGFGDMFARPDSWAAQCIIMIQVLYGYVLLGALISVLSNLFISDGPAQGLIIHPRKPLKISFKIQDIP
ncbi:pentapeptide repeat-containing protein [Pseudomonas nunensis]|uniref:Pentapeptide repeat-containing protein n=1 Tax=Pseudomonas nunensis TaxID=2961896 RepID=A0ABY5EM50_9PSED|nr:pentapeptide repeat-containing protein [Pseudomonas nunensis]MCL5224956.1 pentapeptide repeat-containing protein [Pseudomonas nunensis]UTO16283.1 pentapeptide repeat-containing protein [Pseudomonas nunensis]